MQNRLDTACCCSQEAASCMHYAAPCEQVRMMCQLWNELEVTILPHYTPSEAERQDPELYAKNVRQLYAQHLGVPLAPQV